MFHAFDNLYFGRRTDGSVRVLKLHDYQLRYLPTLSADMHFPEADGAVKAPILDMTIPADMWASVVASVSARGEADGRFFLAKAFHNATTP